MLLHKVSYCFLLVADFFSISCLFRDFIFIMLSSISAGDIFALKGMMSILLVF